MFPQIDLPEISVRKDKLPKISIKTSKIIPRSQNSFLNTFGFSDLIIFPSKDDASFISTNNFTYESNTSKMYLVGIVNTISIYWKNGNESPNVLIISDDNTLAEKLSTLYPQLIINTDTELTSQQCDMLFICTEKYSNNNQRKMFDDCGAFLGQLSYKPEDGKINGILLANIFSPKDFNNLRYILLSDKTDYDIDKKNLDRLMLSFKNNTRAKRYENGTYDKAAYIWTLEKYLERWNRKLTPKHRKSLDNIFN